MSAIDISRQSITLPAEISNIILQNTQKESAIMRLATQIPLPGNGAVIPVITGDPEAGWVGETEEKPVSTGTATTKMMQAYKLAVIEPFSQEFMRDSRMLYEAMVKRIPAALGKKFDNTVMGGTTAPGSNFDTFASSTAVALAPATAYDTLVTVQGDIADHDGSMNGIAISPKAKTVLLKAKDTTGRPIFIDGVASDAVPRILGAEVYENNGVYVPAASSNPAVVGVAGDFTKALYGTVEGMQMSISDQATLKLANGETINLWQRNMVAVRVEIEIGFRALTECFNRLTYTP